MDPGTNPGIGELRSQLWPSGLILSLGARARCGGCHSLCHRSLELWCRVLSLSRPVAPCLSFWHPPVAGMCNCFLLLKGPELSQPRPQSSSESSMCWGVSSVIGKGVWSGLPQRPALCRRRDGLVLGSLSLLVAHLRPSQCGTGSLVISGSTATSSLSLSNGSERALPLLLREGSQWV